MIVRDYLNQLPEPHKSRALKYENEKFNKEVDNLYEALYEFENWGRTIEKSEYWSAVQDGCYYKALEICPITEDEMHLIEPKKLKDIASKKVSGFEATAREQIANRVKLEREFDNKLTQLFINLAIDWLYLQYEIYGYLTPQMVQKAKEKSQ